MDYRPALLWLMGRLERATPSQALAEFERAFSDLIPPEHHEQNESGNIKWEWYVRWSRLDLVIVGLMGSGGRGIWTITPEGQQWLAEHPDGGGDQLKAQVGAARKGRKQVVFRAQAEREAADESQLEHQRPIEFTAAGHRYRLSAQQVLEKARQATADGIPPEAKRYKEWVADVDGQPVSVKWLFSLATGLDTGQFKTPEARRVLGRMGLEIRSMRQISPAQPSGVPAMAPPSDALPQQEFLDQVARAVQAGLPSWLTPSVLQNRGNCLRIAYPEFHISHLHYEVYLQKTRHEIALHFESAPEVNLAWLDHFKPQADHLSQLLGHPVQAERWGRRWARVSISLPRRSLSAALAQEIGGLMANFVQATYPIMQEALGTVPLVLPGRGRRPSKLPDDAERRYRLLDVEVRAVRDFLDGNAHSRPGDERLCYWVYLCLTLELHEEGARLFTLIDPSQVQKPLYEYTRRFADVCRFRAEV